MSYVEIRRKSVFDNRVICGSDIPEICDSILDYRSGELSVSRDGGLLISTDGFSFLRVGNTIYRNTNIIQLNEISSSDKSMSFDWWPERDRVFRWNDRCDIHSQGHRYEITNSIFFPFWYLTKVTVNFTEQHCSNFALACGCLMWLYYEKRRHQTA